jgi:hypothetical protein
VRELAAEQPGRLLAAGWEPDVPPVGFMLALNPGTISLKTVRVSEAK